MTIRIKINEKQGVPGLSAYQLALDNGFVGTVEEWLLTLEGKSAYQVALDNGFVGTEQQWLDSLKAIIPVSHENAGMIYTNDGESTLWDSIENILNNRQINWDLGEI